MARRQLGGASQQVGTQMHVTPKDRIAPITDSAKVCTACGVHVEDALIRYVKIKITAAEPGFARQDQRVLVCRRCHSIYHNEMARTDPRGWDPAAIERINARRARRARMAAWVQDRAAALNRQGLDQRAAFRQAWIEAEDAVA